MKGKTGPHIFSLVKGPFLLLAFSFLILCVFAPDSSGELPDGSYKQSCKTENCTDSNSVLGCSCKKRDGNYKPSSVDYSRCQSGAIWNENGTLICKPDSSFPAGSYKNSCGNCTDDASDTGYAQLSCQCKKKNGSYVGSTMYTNICDGGIWNDDGELKCNPKGTFKKTCNTIVWDYKKSITASCKTTTGKWTGSRLTIPSDCSTIENCNGVLKCGGCGN